MANRDLVVRFVGDQRDLQQAFAQSTRQAKGFQAEVSGLGSTISRSFGRAFLAAGGTAAVMATVKRSVNAASDLNEEVAKSQEVFGSASVSVEDWSKTTARSLGIARTEALQATGIFGNLFRVVEIAPSKAAEMSQALVQLAADLASFNNADPSDVLQALRSGLIGEAEPMRRYGVLLSETRVQQQALIETGKSNVKNLTDQEKALARYNIILQDTTAAQGDVQRTSGSLANQSRQLNAQLKDLSATLGNVLVPALTDAVTGVNQLFDAGSRLAGVEVFGQSSGNIVKNFFKWTNPVILQARLTAAALDKVTASANESAAAVANAPLRPDDRAGVRGPGGIAAEQRAREATAKTASQKRFAAHMKGLGLKLETAGLTKTLADDVRVLREMERSILRQIRIEGKTFELQQDLIRTRQRIQDTLASEATTASQSSDVAVEKIAAAERKRLANQRKQFEALGLTASGDERVPGAGSLRNRAQNLLKQLKGTPLDTDRTRSQLRRIAKVLAGAYGKVGKDVRQAILGMLNDISSALNGGRSSSTGSNGPLTATTGLNTRKIIAGLGLSPEQIRELRGRLSSFNTAGRALGTGNRTTSGGMGTPIVVENYVTVQIGDKKIVGVVTKEQQKGSRRNPRQKRGPNRLRPGI